MIVVIQKVSEASVSINGKVKSEIARGLLVLVGIEEKDLQEDIDWLSTKVVNLRIFEDEGGVMNLSVKDVGGDLIVVSQFTLQASTKKETDPLTSRQRNLKSLYHCMKPLFVQLN